MYGLTPVIRATSPILKKSLSGRTGGEPSGPCGSNGPSGFCGSLIRSAGRGSAGGAPARAWLLVELTLQDLRRLERQNAALGDGDLGARLRVATDSLLLVTHHEVSETGDLDLVAVRQRLLHRLEDALDQLRGLLL